MVIQKKRLLIRFQTYTKKIIGMNIIQKLQLIQNIRIPIQKEKEEIGRIIGYSSAEMFWWQVDEILDLD